MLTLQPWTPRQAANTNILSIWYDQTRDRTSDLPSPEMDTLPLQAVTTKGTLWSFVDIGANGLGLEDMYFTRFLMPSGGYHFQPKQYSLNK